MAEQAFIGVEFGSKNRDITNCYSYSNWELLAKCSSLRVTHLDLGFYGWGIEKYISVSDVEIEGRARDCGADRIVDNLLGEVYFLKRK